MSNSRMYQVPTHLALSVQHVLAEFQKANPIAAMGADERRAHLRKILQSLRHEPSYSAVVEEALLRPRPPGHEGLPVSVDDTELFNAVQARLSDSPSSAAGALLATMASWPRGAEDEEAFRRRTTFSAMVSQLLSEALNHRDPTLAEVGPRKALRKEASHSARLP